MKRMMLALMFLSATAFAAESGKPAPDFSLKGISGKEVKLADLKGKTVVLEWLNHGCPFVRKHYGSGNMQKLQKEYTGKGVVWFSVISSAPGKEGHSTPAQAEADKKEKGASPSDILIDESGKIGKLYGAQTTPHMFVIDGKGTLVYQGAIDDKASAEKEDIIGAKNYVREALEAVMAGKQVAVAQTKSYGCSVKY